MTPLSVAIIARDEVDRLERAIRSVPFADEILVLDSGSTDGTVELAERLGARVLRTDWPGYVVQKNRALTECKHRWVLSLDADEHLDPALAAELQRALAGEPAVAGFVMRRLTWWMGARIQHGAWGRDWKLRLVDRERARWIGRDPHDQLECDGPVTRLGGALHHHPYRDLGEHLATIDRYTALSAEGLAREGRKARWFDLLFRPPAHFVASYLLKGGFLDGARGLALAILGAAYVSLKWTRLYLRGRGGGGEP